MYLILIFVLTIFSFNSEAAVSIELSDDYIELSDYDLEQLRDKFFIHKYKPTSIKGVKYKAQGKNIYFSQVQTIFPPQKSSLNICKSQIIFASFSGQNQENIDYTTPIRRGERINELVWVSNKDKCEDREYGDATILSSPIAEPLLLNLLTQKKLVLDAATNGKAIKTNLSNSELSNYLSQPLAKISIEKRNNDYLYSLSFGTDSCEFLSIELQITNGAYDVSSAFVVLC